MLNVELDRLRAMTVAADREIERLRAVLQDIERHAGEFGSYPEPADALLAIEQMVQKALRK